MMGTSKARAAFTLGIAGLALSAASASACGDRESFKVPVDGPFTPDASVDTGVDCLLQCSLDGRAVVRACTGEIVQECPPELACGAGACREPCEAAAADRRSNGCEFYFQPPLFTKYFGQSCYAAFVVNTSTVPVDVSLELEGRSLDISKSLFRTEKGSANLIPHTGSIPVGESVILFVSDRDPTSSPAGRTAPCPEGAVPAMRGDTLPDGTGIGTSFHLRTNVPVSAAAIYPFGGAQSFLPSATLLLPVPTWGKEHLIVNAWETTSSFAYVAIEQPGAQIVASEDDTDVTILPARDIQDGAGVVGSAARVPVTYRLSRGQVLQLKQAEELSGSFVTSSKPTSVFGGHACMTVPAGRDACDTALQQLPSFDQWGSEYVGVGYRPRIGNEHEPMAYRIVAARDETRLSWDPVVPAGAPVTMSAGEVATFWGEVGTPFVVRTQDAEHPIYLAAYMSGGGTAESTDVLGDQNMLGKGDAEFVNVVPAGQYLSSYSFYADPTYTETSLVIVRAKSNGKFDDVWLECAGVLSGFEPVGTRGDYEYVRVDLAKGAGPGETFGTSTCQNGLHRMRSDGPFTATLWGWSYYASYAYPGGMAQRRLVETPLTIVR